LVVGTWERGGVEQMEKIGFRLLAYYLWDWGVVQRRVRVGGQEWDHSA